MEEQNTLMVETMDLPSKPSEGNNQEEEGHHIEPSVNNDCNMSPQQVFITRKKGSITGSVGNGTLEEDCIQTLLVPVCVISTDQGRGNDNIISHNPDTMGEGVEEANQNKKETAVVNIVKTRDRKCKKPDTSNCTDRSQKQVVQMTNCTAKGKRKATTKTTTTDIVVEKTARITVSGGKEEDEEEDEFEDEKEFEGCKFGMRTADERSRRVRSVSHVLETVIPMPVLRRASISLQLKMEIIQELASGAKQSAICKTKRIPKSTVQSIWKNREKIQAAVEKIGMGRKRCRRAQHEDVEVKLVEWIDTLKSQNVPVNGPQLRAKAQVFAKQMGITEFRSSTGWLDKFKTRHNIAFKKSVKETNSAADKKLALDWVTKIWPKMCEGYFPENIFNLDEFGLYWHALPDQTTKLMNDPCHGGKCAQDRLTVLACSNSDGSEKRKLNVVGNYKLSGIVNVNNLPVKYQQDNRSWLTKPVLVQELRQWDTELRVTGRNILLILNDSPAHTVTETFSNIKLVFLPRTVAKILQPFRRLIQLVKSQYRRLFLDNVTRKYQQQQINKSASSLNITLMEALSMLDCAWIDVKPRSIANCFKTSNLQSVTTMSSSDSTDSTDVNGNQEKCDVIFDLELMERASLAGIPMLPDLNFSTYVEIDSRLQVTDYANESRAGIRSNSNNLNNPVFNVRANTNNTNIPCKPDVQNYLIEIRNWLSSLSADIEPSVHQSIGVLENFTLRQLNEQYQHCENDADLINNLNQFNVGSSRVILSTVQNHNQSNVNSSNTSILSVPCLPISSNSSSNGTTITFTISDAVEQSDLLQGGSSVQATSPLPQLMDQQQFFAYLT